MQLNNWIKGRISQEYDVNILISGGTGSGKSWAALRICELNDPTFNKNRVVFGITDYIKRYHDDKEQLKKYEAILFDETGVEVSGLKVMHREVKNVLDELMTNRTEGTIGVFTTPSKDDVPQRVLRLMHLWIKITGRNNTYSFAKPYYVVYDEFSRKVKFKRVRDRKTRKGVTFKINKPSPTMISYYQQAKREYREALGEKLKGKKPSSPLTDKQKEVLALSTVGLTQEQIASKVGRSQQLISSTLKAINQKGYNLVQPYSSIKGGDINDK